MIHLVLGGARSGKSSEAEAIAASIAEKKQNTVTYVATAGAGDLEMAERIKLHQASRPNHWHCIEQTLSLSNVLQENNKPETTLLIDCMTLWVTNWLCLEDHDGWPQEKQDFLSAIKQFKGDIVIVSNEVGSGIVPLGELNRSFVDQAGWLNQSLAALSDTATLVVAGLPLKLKANKHKS